MMGLGLGLALSKSPGSVTYTLVGNIVTAPEDFGNAAWTKDGTTASVNTTVAPDGSITADTLTATAANVEHRVYQSITNAPHSKTIYAKPGTINFICIANGNNTAPYAVFNLSNGTISLTGGGAAASISGAANGFYKCTVNDNATATNFFVVSIGNTALNAVPQTAWSAVGTEAVVVWEAQTT